MIIVYKALVESLIRYGIIIWGGLYNTALKQLNVIQNFILKIINKKEKRYPTQSIYSVNILNIRSLYILSVCLYVHKIQKFKKYPTHNHATRNKSMCKLQIPMSNKNINQRFINYLGPTLYNMLPVDVRGIQRMESFKLACRKYIFDNNIQFISGF